MEVSHGRRYPLAWLAIGTALWLASMPLAARAEEAPVDPAQLDFFEAKVRPLLVQHCNDCHGADLQEAGLRLDLKALALKGSEAGTVLVPGKPDESRVIQAIRYTGKVQMPPDGKLPEEAINILTQWVASGAAWTNDPETPADPTVASSAFEERSAQQRANHWAFQPVKKSELPAVKDAAWGAQPIDRYILAKLETAGLAPSPAADRRTLLRRVTFDLIGLPPTAEEVAAFEADTTPDAYAKVVDRLLASPHYGERWGRHWLDVARYADTKGYVFTEERRYAYSYTYRDYVIRAFNEDRPYNQFVLEQLAADKLENPDPWPLAAMGYLTLGRRFSNNQHDIIDDRIDVVSRGLLGLTVSCARCHDHKYDAIPTADYYSLYGIFASSVEPADLPLIGQPAQSEAYAAYQAELGKRELELKTFTDAKHQALEAELRVRAKDYLMQLTIDRMKALADQNAAFAMQAGELAFQIGEIRPQVTRRWSSYLERTAREHHPVFSLWHEFHALNPNDFAAGAAPIMARLADPAQNDPAKPINARVRDAFVKQPPTSIVDVGRTYGTLLAETLQQWTDLQAAHTQAVAAQGAAAGEVPTALPDPAAEELRQVLFGANTPAVVEADEARRLFDRATKVEFGAIKNKVDEWKVNSPDAPPRGMVLADAENLYNPRIFLRGNADRIGDVVPRQFLKVLSPADRQPFKQGSGRLELAQNIASADNPLTARVLVNRVWGHHFGTGLVRTPSDFGVRSDPPSHPELLDYLAATFMERNWSIKQLHREILLSNVYQQSSAVRADAVAVDPENLLLARMNRLRLEFEPLRDSLLAVAGNLDRKLGGRPIDLWAQPFTGRRSVYAYIDRQDLPGVFRVFDFASPDASAAERPKTTVPQQALFVMNSPFVLEQAKRLAERPEVTQATDPAARVAALYTLIFARAPTAQELELAQQYIAQSPATDPAATQAAWNQLAQALLLTNEFLFVD